MGPHLPRLRMAAKKGWKNTGLHVGVTECGRSRKWGCRGRLTLGFKPRLDSHTRGWDYAALAEEAGETLPGRKGEKGLLLVGHEKVPHVSGLTGDCGSHTANGARSLNHGLLLLFLRYGTPDWAEGEGRTVCICGYSREL